MQNIGQGQLSSKLVDDKMFTVGRQKLYYLKI